MKLYIYRKNKKNNDKIFPLCQVYKPDVKKWTYIQEGGKWLIHDSKHHNDNQMQRMNPPL